MPIQAYNSHKFVNYSQLKDGQLMQVTQTMNLLRCATKLCRAQFIRQQHSLSLDVAASCSDGPIKTKNLEQMFWGAFARYKIKYDWKIHETEKKTFKQ